ncbi:hypothetical protein [Afipia felis]|uniref:Uncharacterized protein n=2 Tax=Afipia felis TaxID=1035 RepID=A0A380WAY3_AFIFE|nr:hypothetical protein [Afipia felis]EKS29387.1 hypothetical protein HMPREF9697_01915 [Afipia felis ATCC 53690]SUU78095.1 Uncharacterised protein [Afipia felis]SUU86160.1 Uncharacterised protein [Afipia felis]
MAPTKSEIRRVKAARARATTALAQAFMIVGLNADKAYEFAATRIDDAVFDVDVGLQDIGTLLHASSSRK